MVNRLNATGFVKTETVRPQNKFGLFDLKELFRNVFLPQILNRMKIW